MNTQTTYNWAVLGCGKIAKKFAADLQLLPNAKRYSTASRSLVKAKEFAGTYGFEKAYGSYKAMVNDTSVNIVYIATPHSLHLEHSLLCLQHKKAVLCEKAFAMNTQQVQQMIVASKQNNCFLMEAFWTRFNPAFLKVLDIIDSKELGPLKHVKSDFKFLAPFDSKHRLFNMDLGGGSLLDIGIYPVFAALMTLGVPDQINAHTKLSPTGSDAQLEILFLYDNGSSANLSSGFHCTAFNDSDFLFEKGALRISRELNRPMLYKKGYEVKELNIENEPGLGYQLEAQHVMNCLDMGLKESPLLPLDFSLQLIQTLDRIREVAGIQYSCD